MEKVSFTWPNENICSEVSRKAQRQAILESIYIAKSGHPGGSFSLVEILSVIFDGNFNHNPKLPNLDDRDRIVLSKGHGVPALYSALSFSGYFPPDEMAHLRELGHFLQGHPDKIQYPLMEASTGSLGQGCSVALGLAMGLAMKFERNEIKRLPKVYCILGDGEMQEGQVWECLMSAGKFMPGNLIFVLDYNKGQIDGPVSEVMDLEPIVDKIKSFKLDARTVDGHDVNQLKELLASIDTKPKAKPSFIVAHTLKGKGVSFIEHPTKWHGAAPNKEQLEEAINELWDGSVSPAGRLSN